jgi:hypothetical protein
LNPKYRSAAKVQSYLKGYLVRHQLKEFKKNDAPRYVPSIDEDHLLPIHLPAYNHRATLSAFNFGSRNLYQYGVRERKKAIVS